jgi:glycosyltransferase involved in cell wall biosynthesis
MRLLHIGCNAGSESMPKYFRDQCDYREFKLDKNLQQNIRDLLESADSGGWFPDRVFIQIQSDTIDGISTCNFIGHEIRQLKEKGAFVINWTGDKRNDLPRWMVDFHNFVNITAFSNEEDVNIAHQYGMDSLFLQQGIDTNIFKPEGKTVNCPEIIFLANNYGNQFPLSKYRRQIADRLSAEFGNKFGVYGNGWNRGSGNLNHSQYEEAKYYRSCKIAISCSHYDSERYFSDRLGRALCSGAFVLSHNYKGIQKDFQIGEHLMTFANTDQLVSVCRMFLDEPDTRNGIARRGQELASKEFSYQNIVKQILEL